MGKREEIKEGVAKQLHAWLHSTGSPSWESKKTAEVVRVAHRKRADELLSYLHSQGVGIIKASRFGVEPEPLIEGGIWTYRDNDSTQG